MKDENIVIASSLYGTGKSDNTATRRKITGISKNVRERREETPTCALSLLGNLYGVCPPKKKNHKGNINVEPIFVHLMSMTILS